MASSSSNRVCIGQILGPHGVKGLVKLRGFTEDPSSMARYTQAMDETGGRHFHITLRSHAKNDWIASIEGVGTRDQAETLRGCKLYVPRSDLPSAAAGQYYYVDLIGLNVVSVSGQPMGSVVNVYNYGAGDFLEIKLNNAGNTEMLPFTQACVPIVKIEEGYIGIDPPIGWQDAPSRKE